MHTLLLLLLLFCLSDHPSAFIFLVSEEYPLLFSFTVALLMTVSDVSVCLS